MLLWAGFENKAPHLLPLTLCFTITVEHVNS